MGLLEKLGLGPTPNMAADATADVEARGQTAAQPRAGGAKPQNGPAVPKLPVGSTAYAGALAKAEAAMAALSTPEAAPARATLQTTVVDAAKALAKSGKFDEATALLGGLQARIDKALDDAAKAKAAADQAKAAAAKLVADKQAYDQARAVIQPHVDAGTSLQATHGGAFKPAQIKAYDKANKATDALANGAKWTEAVASLPALDTASLALQATADDHDAFFGPFHPFVPDYHEAWNARIGPGVRQQEGDAFWAQAETLEQAVTDREWKAALAVLPPLKTATTAVRKLLVEGRAYYAAYEAARADIETGREAFTDPDSEVQDLAGPKATYYANSSGCKKVVREKKWNNAKGRVEPWRLAAIALAQKLDAVKAAKGPYEAALASLNNLDAARSIAAKAPPKIKDAEAKAFLEKYAVFNDARNNGDFAAAAAAIPPLQVAIDALLAASAKDGAEMLEYLEALSKVPDRAAAAAIAAAPTPAMAGAASAWTLADTATREAADRLHWVAAKAAAGALKTATDKLLEARGNANKDAKPADFDAFNQKLLALKPRTDKAKEADQTRFVGTKQTAVIDLLALIDGFVAAKDLVSAEASFAKLPPLLVAMEQAKAAAAAHQLKFVAARDGGIKQARATALQPGDLGAKRDQALDEEELTIIRLADGGDTAGADASVAKWLLEAKAWTGAKEAYDSLMSKTPSEAKLKALADKPGGAGVMDALVAALPEDASQRVLSTAMKARFGIKISSFEKKNEDAEDFTGVAKVDKDLPNKSVQKMYEILSKVPIDMRGKVTDIIDFKKDGGGAMYNLNKKIYMYCGRPDDPEAGEQAFNEKGKIVPEGEEVQEDCKPKDDTPVPYFDFALLHEAGHAEDDAAPNFMGAHQNNSTYGGWSIDLNPGAAAEAASKHFKYDKAYILSTLRAAGSIPPAVAPLPPKGTDKDVWEKARLAVLEWTKLIRTDNSLWDKAALSKKLAIDGRVYQEAYGNYWVSYEYAARAQGITGYQFRSHWEWFAELYAAYFSDRLKDSHPAVTWLKKYKTPKVA